MKKTFITLLFLIITLISFGQVIDENGRTIEQRAAVKPIAAPEVYFKELAEVKTPFSSKISYSLPEGKSNGEIRFFNPIKDEELKSIKVSERKGIIVVRSTDFSIKNVVAGLYADGVFLESIRLNL
jgi:hypothetical protein